MKVPLLDLNAQHEPIQNGILSATVQLHRSLNTYVLFGKTL